MNQKNFFSELMGEHESSERDLFGDFAHDNRKKKSKKQKRKDKRKEKEWRRKQRRKEEKKRQRKREQKSLVAVNQYPPTNALLMSLGRGFLKLMFKILGRTIDNYFDSSRALPPPRQQHRDKDMIYTRFVDDDECSNRRGRK